MNDMIEVKTTAGILRAYKSKDPGQPGIYVVFQANGSDDEIDMSYVSVYEDPDYRTSDNERSKDVVIMTYGDCSQEDYTRKDIIRREDLVEVLEIENAFQKEKEWVIKEIGPDIIGDLPDDVYHHYYRAMHDYDMGYCDADEWAWLNTLFGYDIGAERAKEIVKWYYENGLSVSEIGAEDIDTLKNICELELGFHLNFSEWPKETPEAIIYGHNCIEEDLGDSVLD